jgi:tetratricopeptide (TPR) repeat protein
VSRIPRRVFLSHTSELARLPARGSFVDAAFAAVSQAGDVIVNMRYFGVRADPPAEVCIQAVNGSDVYVGIIGSRYGSPVHDRQDVSYTELEYETALSAQKPMLVLMLDEEAVDDPSFHETRYADRQRAFRDRVLATNVTRVTVRTPDQLALELFRGLDGLPNRETAGIHQFPTQTPVFTGRAEVIEQLYTAFESGQRIHVVHGMGGIGKTTTVIEFCDRYRDEYDIIWWVAAEEPTLIPDSLAQLAFAMGIAEESQTTVSAVSRLRTTLTRRRRWLIVFDNVRDASEIIPYLISGPGHTLITSRNPSFDDLATSTALDRLHRDESTKLLRKRLPQLPDRDAERVADALDHLPLALTQAAAYLADTGMTVDDYLRLLDIRAADVLAEGKPANYPLSFVSGLSVALDSLAADRRPALDLLTVAAFMAPEPIPLALFSTQSANLPAPLSAAAADPLTFAGITRLVRQRGLARITVGSMQIHPLVQSVLRERWSDSGREVAVDLLAARLLGGQQPDVASWTELLPHVLVATAANTASDAEPLPIITERLLYAAAKHLRTRGQATVARPILERVCRSREARHGPVDTLVGNALINLGWALRDLGDPAGAFEAYQRALIIRRLHYPADHPQVATALTNCGLSLRELGRPQEARPLLEDALNLRTNAFGPDHRHVATVLTYLGATLTDLGEPHAAREHLERALDIRRRTYGSDHRHVATVLTHLGQSLAALDEADTARQYLESALHIREQAYGPDHPRVAVTAEILGLVMNQLKDPIQARALLGRAHQIVVSAYGPTHPASQRTAATAASLTPRQA